jgi:soluble cytochrome b562
LEQITIGDIKIEIPPEKKIDFTGQRTMVKYDVPGDRPRYQDMGREERTIHFNGIFYGDDAYKKALALQDYYDSGKNIDNGTQTSGFAFTFEEISCRVLIKNYSHQYYRKDMVRYDIELVRLESDFDQKTPEKANAVDKITKAQNGLDKLKTDIGKAMQTVHNVTAAAKQVQETLYKARKSYMDVTKSIKNPISQMRQEIQNTRRAFDNTLHTVNQSIGRTSTAKSRKQLQTALQTMQNTIPTAQGIVTAAQKTSVDTRLNEKVSQLSLHTVLQNENLRTVAASALGSPHEWGVLARINKLHSVEIPATMKAIRVPDTSNVADVKNLLTEKDNQIPNGVLDYIPRNLR